MLGSYDASCTQLPQDFVTKSGSSQNWKKAIILDVDDPDYQSLQEWIDAKRLSLIARAFNREAEDAEKEKRDLFGIDSDQVCYETRARCLCCVPDCPLAALPAGLPVA